MIASIFELKMFPSSTSTTAAGAMSGATEHVGIGAAEHVGIGAEEHKVPIVEVAFNHGLWWSIPQAMSGELYEKYINGEDAGYTWDWGEGGRVGSWKPDGDETTINRYVIDFYQRKRSIRRSIANGCWLSSDALPAVAEVLQSTRHREFHVSCIFSLH